MIEELQQRLAEGQLLSEPEMQRLRETAEADEGGITRVGPTRVANMIGLMPSITFIILIAALYTYRHTFWRGV